MKIALFLTSILVASCAGGSRIEAWRAGDPPPGAEDAVKMIENEYRLIHVPELTWYGGAGLDCVDNPNAWCIGGTCRSSNTDCADGVFFDWTQELAVSNHHGAPPSQTALAHELWHQKLFEETGYSDQDHKDDGFQPGGAVQTMREHLAAEGL